MGEPKREEDTEEAGDGDLHALNGKGKGKCYNCGGKGHVAANCPSPSQKGGGKGGTGFPNNKGVGKGKGLGKGGKGPVEGCWTCGAKHYQSDCPKGKGKGKLGWFEAPDSYADWEYGGGEEGYLKYLSSLTLGKKGPRANIESLVGTASGEGWG